MLCVIQVLLEDALDGIGRDPLGHHLGEVGLTESFAHLKPVCPPGGNLMPSKERGRIGGVPSI